MFYRVFSSFIGFFSFFLLYLFISHPILLYRFNISSCPFLPLYIPFYPSLPFYISSYLVLPFSLLRHAGFVAGKVM
ncbi:hypothetical protein MSKOL_1960 [Methanosarcina sp. Kolksee]|nr:hypothetical protein MSKOL_1960 [Methanosarcina sp. Kolksee]